MKEELLSLNDYELTSPELIYSGDKGQRIFRHSSMSGLLLHFIFLFLLTDNSLLITTEAFIIILYASLIYGFYKKREKSDWIVPAAVANVIPFVSLIASHIIQQTLLRNHYYMELGLSLVMVASVQFLNRKRLFRTIIICVLSGWLVLTVIAGAVFVTLDGGYHLSITGERLEFFFSYLFLTSMIGLSAFLSLLNFHYWERLRRRESRKNTVQELLTRESKLGLFMTDAALESVIGNPSFYQIVEREYTPKPQKIKEIMSDIVHKNDLPSILRTVEELKEANTESLPIDIRIGTEDSNKWIRLDGLFTKEEAGAPFFLGSFTDIDHLKRSEERALADSSSIKALLMAGQIYPWILDLESNLFLPIDSSGKGVSPYIGNGQISLEKHFDSMDKDFRPVVEQAFEAVSRGESPVLEVDYLFNSRELNRNLWLKDVGFASRLDRKGRPLRINGYTMDIDSDRRQALRIDQAFRASGFIPWQWDRRKGYAELDKDYIDLLGVPMDRNPISRRDFFLRLIHEEDRGKVKAFFTRHESGDGETGRIGVPLQFRIRFHGMEDIIWIEGRITGTQYDKNGSPLFVEGIFRNITREKRRELHLAEEKRGREVAHAKNMIFSTVSHELLTPMNVLLGTIGLFRNTELDRSQVELLEKISLSSNLLLGRIEELLDISDLGQGELSLASDIFSPADLLGSIIKDLKNTAQAEGITLDLVTKGSLPPLFKGDKGRIEQIIRNLVKNGITFTPRGKVVLSAESEELFPGSCRFEVTVADEGIGIPSEKLAAIFEPFGQVDNSTARRQQGIGLSLAINKQLVELMGGSLKVESTLGKGSVFTMELPMEIASSRDKGTGGGTYIYPGSKVLIVDDNPMNREIAADLLALRKIKAITAAGGLEGLEAISLESPDLVFMDVQMPGIDGYEATRRQREREDINSHIPIIALTANITGDDRAMAYKSGMDGFLPKPIDKRKIDIMLNKWLKEFRLAMEDEASTAVSENPPIPGIAMEETLERFSGEYDILKELLEDYREDYRDFCTHIEELMDRNDTEEVYARIHALKGVSGSLGITEVFNVSRRMADQYRGTQSFRPDDVAALKESMGRFLAGLAEFLES